MFRNLYCSSMMINVFPFIYNASLVLFIMQDIRIHLINSIIVSKSWKGPTLFQTVCRAIHNRIQNTKPSGLWSPCTAISGNCWSHKELLPHRASLDRNCADVSVSHNCWSLQRKLRSLNTYAERSTVFPSQVGKESHFSNYANPGLPRQCFDFQRF